MTPIRTLPLRRTAALALVLSVAACKSETRPSNSSDSVTSQRGGATPPAVATGASDVEAPFAFTDADLDAYEKGMRKEIELVKAAKLQGDSAKTPAERGAASQA